MPERIDPNNMNKAFTSIFKRKVSSIRVHPAQRLTIKRRPELMIGFNPLMIRQAISDKINPIIALIKKMK